MLNSGLPHNSMDAKEEILNRCIKDQTGGLTLSWGSCIKAMDEYAYKKAVDFAEWLGKNNWMPGIRTMGGICYFQHAFTKEYKTIQEIYQIFEDATNRSKGIKNE